MKNLNISITVVACAFLLQVAGADVWEDLAKFKYTDGNNTAQEAEKQLRASPSAANPAIEKKLIVVLTSRDATQDGKAIACRLLQQIGTDNAVSALSDLLTDEVLSHYALLPLERLQSSSADKAMRDALSKAPAKLKVGLLGSIGERRDAKALKAIQVLAKDRDIAVSRASIVAIGKIANDDAAKFLAGLEVPESLVAVQLDALLACAERLEGSLSARLYEKVLESKGTHYRIASLKGLLHTDGKKGAKLIVESIKGDDASLRKGVLGLVAGEPGDDLTKAVVAALGNLAMAQQSEVITALGARGDSAALKEISGYVKSEDAGVRDAAIAAVGQLGNVDSVAMLLELGQSRELAAKASAAIARMEGDGINDALISAMKNKDLQVPALKAIVARGGKDAAPSLLKLVNDKNPDLRKEAWSGLATIAGDKDLGAMVKASASIKDSSAQGFALSAIKRAFSRARNKEAAFNGIADHFDSANNLTKLFVLDLATGVGSRRALDMERAALTSGNEELRQKAIRALANWSNASAAGDLLKLAKDAASDRDRLLALRGYIRLAGTAGGIKSGQERTAMLKQADALAKRTDEKRMIVGNLRSGGTPEALKMLFVYIKDESLRREAELSAAELAWNLRRTKSEEVRKLTKELTGSSNKGVANKARSALAEMNKVK
ncbi:MAG: HEAT repeat domain-containing protein [Opitutae bacterium]|nr:HEAT repeat domain-containing protein [Opitutae bacterium]